MTVLVINRRQERNCREQFLLGVMSCRRLSVHLTKSFMFMSFLFNFLPVVTQGPLATN